VEVAEAQLALTEAGPQPEAVRAAERRVAAAQASLSQAVANRDDTLTIGTEPEIEAARAQVASTKAAREQLEQQYETILDSCFETPDGDEVCPLYGPVEEQTRAQLQAARQREAAAQAQLDRLRAGPTAAQQRAAGGGVAVATAQLEQAEAQLAQLQAGATAEQVEQARVGVAQAEVGVAQAEVRVTEAETAVQRAETAVAAAQVAVDEAQLALERLTLRATVDGTVADVMVDPAQIISSGSPALTLADFSGWQVTTTDLTELDVARVSPGTTVSVGFDAIPEQQVTGTVSEIALTPSLSQGDVVYEVTVDLEPAPDLPLRWGMTAFVDIDA
jgi:HlyD family secretion protein